ncbi:MAG: sn-glycerol-3-phosphate ABC transporter ATP-binding protein UgpC [Candidatus Velthaea sp.]
MASVRIESLYKKYGETAVVKDVNLEIADREFLVFVGPSGCGKTTTLRMIAGLEDISSGNIFIGDKRVNDIPPKDRDIAMVFQNYALYPHMNVYDNMAFGLKMRKFSTDEIERRVKNAAEILDIGPLLKRRPKEMSGGQRQRAALGRAIVRDPAVFLMDEPLSNLDAKLRVQMRTEIAKLHRRVSTTTIYVTHDQVEAMTMGDRIVVMKDGVVQQLATPKELYDKPVNTFVAGFIGSPMMSFLDCGIIRENGISILHAPSFRIPIPADKNARLTPVNGANVTLGIRPEDVRIVSESDPAGTVSSIVDVVEPLGSEQVLYLLADGQRIHARVASELVVKPGDALKLAVNTDRIHVFETVSGAAYF